MCYGDPVGWLAGTLSGVGVPGSAHTRTSSCARRPDALARRVRMTRARFRSRGQRPVTGHCHGAGSGDAGRRARRAALRRGRASSRSALGAFDRRLAARIGKPHARSASTPRGDARFRTTQPRDRRDPRGRRFLVVPGRSFLGGPAHRRPIVWRNGFCHLSFLAGLHCFSCCGNPGDW